MKVKTKTVEKILETKIQKKRQIKLLNTQLNRPRKKKHKLTPRMKSMDTNYRSHRYLRNNKVIQFDNLD